jgi:1-acyl-sn-glycerol-3-phosphate acyltransferase
MKYISKFILWVLGWKVIGGVAPEKKCIILGVPHTSLWDFFISWIFYKSVGGQANIMVKRKFFFWPACYLMKYMGAIPVEESRGASLVKQMVNEFSKRNQLHLAIAPEATRKPTAKWKGGFHTIARAANVPVYLGFYDWGKKEVGFKEKIELTEDMASDLRRVRQWYKDKGVKAKYPEQFTCGEDLD